VNEFLDDSVANIVFALYELCFVSERKHFVARIRLSSHDPPVNHTLYLCQIRRAQYMHVRQTC